MSTPTVVTKSGITPFNPAANTNIPITVNLPTSLVSGNLLVITFWVGTGPALTNVSASGWTLSYNNADSSGWYVAYLSKISDGTEGANVTVTLSFASSSSPTVMATSRQINGQNATSPLETPVLNHKTGTTWTTSSIIPATSSDLLLADFFANISNGSVTTPPASMTNDRISTNVAGSAFSYSQQLSSNSAINKSITYGGSYVGTSSLICIKGSLANISTSRTFKWNVLSSISLSRIFKWNILALISLSRIFKWNVAAFLSISRIFKWNIRTAVAPFTRTFKWNVIGGVLLNRAFKWNVLQTISPTRTFKWNVRQQIEIIRTFLWEVFVIWARIPTNSDVWTEINENSAAWTPEPVNSTTWR